MNDEVLVLHDIDASIAHASMLGAQNIISKADADRIVRGLEQIAGEFERGEFELLPELEDVHTNIEARLTEKIGAVAGRLHTARSRNDQVATDFRMYVSDACQEAIRACARMQLALIALANDNIEVVMPGYTHLQRAQPVLFAHHMHAYVEMLQRDKVRFTRAMDVAGELPLGSGALAGVPYPIDRQAVADDLGFVRISANSIDAVSDRDFVVEYIHAAALAMVHISRLAEEIVLWSSAEFGFIKLPDAFATGSSIMPQKKNADVAELARGRSARAIGNLTTILVTLKGLPLAYNRDLQEDKTPLLDSEDILLSTLTVFTAMLPKIEVNRTRTLLAAEENYSLATDLADYLVRKGLPFREAHEIVGKIVRYAEEGRSELSGLSIEDYRRFSPLFAKDVLEIDVMSSINSRDVPGGTASGRVSDALDAAAKRVREEFDLDQLDADDAGQRERRE